MKVYRRSINKVTVKPFTHQKFFQDFNWQGCERGDIIWLEDHPNRDICGIFISADNNKVLIQALQLRQEESILRINPVNINQMTAQDYWQGLINETK